MKVSRTFPIKTPVQLKQQLPLSIEQQAFIEQSINETNEILSGRSSKLLLIVGPCSIHNLDAALEFSRRLKTISDEVKDIFHVLMRVYFEKPRSTLGWKGLLYDPFLDGSCDIETGMQWTRKLLLELTDMGMPAAAEFLDPISSNYFGDLITWCCIGARTATSPLHRQMASGLAMPAAFKNSIDGNIKNAVDGVIAARAPHTYIGMDGSGRVCSIETTGNQNAHIVLRGGEQHSNYDPISIKKALDFLEKSALSNTLLVDCSHGNSRRKYEEQSIVFQSVIHQIREGTEGIRGIILESNLEAGNQPHHSDISQLSHNISLTDPCLDWPTTEKLIRWGYTVLKEGRRYSEPQDHLYHSEHPVTCC